MWIENLFKSHFTLPLPGLRLFANDRWDRISSQLTRYYQLAVSLHIRLGEIPPKDGCSVLATAYTHRWSWASWHEPDRLTELSPPESRQYYQKNICTNPANEFENAILSLLQNIFCKTFCSILCWALLFSIEKCAVLIECLNRSFGWVRIWKWATLARICIWFLSSSTTFLLCTFDAVVVLVLTIDACSFRNPFFCKLTLPVSRTNRRHAYVFFSGSHILFISKFSACSGSTTRFAWFSLLVSYSPVMTSALL